MKRLESIKEIRVGDWILIKNKDTNRSKIFYVSDKKIKDVIISYNTKYGLAIDLDYFKITKDEASENL